MKTKGRDLEALIGKLQAVLEQHGETDGALARGKEDILETHHYAAPETARGWIRLVDVMNEHYASHPAVDKLWRLVADKPLVAYAHMNPTHCTDDGALFEKPKDLMWAIIEHAQNKDVFAADPHEMSVAIVSVEDHADVKRFIDTNHIPEPEKCEPLPDPVRREDLLATQQQIYADHPEWKPVRFYFEGEVLDAAGVLEKLMTMPHDFCKPESYNYGHQSVGDAEPFFWQEERALRVFKEAPERFPGWERIVEAAERRDRAEAEHVGGIIDRLTAEAAANEAAAKEETKQ